MTSLIRRFFAGKGELRSKAEALADSVMAVARRPGFYTAGLADDTLEGRFAMVALHGALVIRPLRKMGPEGFQLAEKMGERLFDRFDYALREEGVGDHSIARRMRKLGEEFYGLAGAIDEALESGEGAAVESALVRNGLGGASPGRLATYVRDADARLAGMLPQSLMSGDIDWPEPPAQADDTSSDIAFEGRHH